MSGNRILMCAPTYFDVFYSINPWMKQGAKVDKALARKQWENVRTAVQKAGGCACAHVLYGTGVS
jgi:N-dimethylarginine dimethylaminohydrolase